MTKANRARRRTLAVEAATLAVAFAGGGLFAFIGVPAGWMSGALVCCALASMLGMPVGVNRWMRDGIFMILGTTMGSAVTPATLQSLPTWPVSMALLILSLPVMMFFIVSYLERGARWDRRTSFFAAAPGALSAVIIMSEVSGADMRRVVFGQFIRLFLLVACIPTAIVAAGHSGDVSMPGAAAGTNMLALVLTLCAGIAGGVLGIVIRFPAGAMVGSMLMSAVLYGSGIADETIPVWLLVIGFVVLGANSGSRFAGTTFTTLKTYLMPTVIAVAIASTVSLIFAFAATALTGDPLPKMVLAFMPGALEAMVIMAFILDADPAFVAAHHLVRFLCLAFSLPLVVRFLFRPKDMPTDEDYAAEEEVKD
jgi:membrane AbrB-like protein